MFSFLLIVHVLSTTAGYAGLIATNVYSLFLIATRDAATIRAGLAAWRRSSQIFGPLLGVGVLFGFPLALTLHVSVGSRWLLAAYLLMLIAIAVQAGVMIPWQIRSSRLLANDAIPRMAPVTFVLLSLCLIYAGILGLMLSKPG